jgi:hypothetical protein
VSRTRIRQIGSGILLLGLVVVVVYLTRRSTGGVEETRSPTAYFGEVVQGDTVEHTFLIGNDQPIDLRIEEVVPNFSTVMSVDSLVPPGGEAAVRLAIHTRRMKGPLNEFAQVVFAGDHEPVWLSLRGRVVLPLQLAPQDRVYFLNAVRGEAPSTEILVINHRPAPVRLLEASSDDPVFRVRADTLNEGRRYQLTVELDAEAEVGRHEGTITLRTDSPEYSVREIPALAIVRDLVHTSISMVDFSTTLMDALDYAAVARRTVLVRRHEGTEFEVTAASTDVSMLNVEIEPQAPGESYLVHVSIDPERAVPGTFEGMLRIETNDPTAPVLELPMRGTLLQTDPALERDPQAAVADSSG